MSWSYKMTEELGEGVGLFGVKAPPDGKVRGDVVYRLGGTQDVEGKAFLRFEMHRDGVVTNTDLMTIDEGGLHCAARIGLEGELTKLDPPQTIVAAPLKTGATWDFNGKLGQIDVHQHYKITAEEDVEVPAGRFHAFHIHADQTAPDVMTIDRWFVSGIGIIKDVTAVQNKDGGLLQRITLELKTRPRVAPRPETKPRKVLAVGFSAEAIGPFSTTFPASAPKICARWQGRGLRPQAKIRAVWVAENVGDIAPPNYKIDEATTTATLPDAHGVFTLSRPDDGWAPGDYRVEFYVDDALVETARLKITE